MRRGLAWALTLPLVLLGTQAAHALAYDLVYPQAHERVLARDRSRLSHLPPVVLALAGAVALAALCVAAVDAARGRSQRKLPAWAFALLPPAMFVVQEVLELSLHTGTFGWRALSAPTFLPGLLLQLPIAVAAYAAARLLLRTAVRVGRALAQPHTLRVFLQLVAPPAPTALRARAVVGGCSSRGPPGPPRSEAVQKATKGEGQMRHRLALGALVALAALTFAASAFAHARLSPAVGLAKQLQVFTLAVPTEKENAKTTTIELTLPSGFSIDSFVPSPGWTRSVQQTGSGESAVIQKVTWSGGSVPTGEDATFSFLALPASAKTYTFAVRQTYSDDSVVDWTGAGVVRRAGTHDQGRLVARRRRHVDPRLRRDRARRNRAHRRRRRLARPRRQGPRMTAQADRLGRRARGRRRGRRHRARPAARNAGPSMSAERDTSGAAARRRRPRRRFRRGRAERACGDRRVGGRR